MRVERNFNKRTAPLVEVGQPHVAHGKGDALGVCATMWPSPDHKDQADVGALRMHMTPAEALFFGMSLVAAARDRLKSIGKLD